ncbi:hypothetical protein BKA61DRAFT_735786 [Leptodontidium sp. MPI-SDFR-AT-0119]|nr:hypothetical protein BKA61DRAFT_735786 [Leptodontidium sp. MPI-SDFR-AT-0119]
MRFHTSLVALLYLPFVLSIDTYETIASLDAYKSQRACGQACFWYVGAGAEAFDVLGITLGCTRPVRDSCYCRTDVQAAAVTYLSTCISSQCSGPGVVANDISMATSIYDSYCQGKGYTADTSPASVTATTTSGSGSTTVTKTVYTSLPTSGAAPSRSSASSNIQTPMTSSPSQTSQTPSPTPSTTPPSKAASGSNLGQNDIITIVFGVLGAFIAIAVGIWQGKRSNSALRTMLRQYHRNHRSVRGGSL